MICTQPSGPLCLWQCLVCPLANPCGSVLFLWVRDSTLERSNKELWVCFKWNSQEKQTQPDKQTNNWKQMMISKTAIMNDFSGGKCQQIECIIDTTYSIVALPFVFYKLLQHYWPSDFFHEPLEHCCPPNFLYRPATLYLCLVDFSEWMHPLWLNTIP